MRSVKRWLRCKCAPALLGASCGLLLWGEQAQAQNPYGGGGGGGLPGSGGPARQLGWVPQLRPGAPGTSVGDYDWTGLQWTLDLIAWPGMTVTPPPPLQCFGVAQASQGIGMGSPVQSATFALSGTATFKWVWQPPLVPFNAAPDFFHFPIPPLYTLGYMYLHSYGRGTDASIHITGGVNAGGMQWMDSDPTPNSFDVFGPLSGVAALSGHAILPAGSSNPAVAQLSPTINAYGFAIPNETGHSSGNGGPGFDANWNIYPIILDAPHVSNLPNLPAFNPFGLPKMGDDTNKFIYSGDTPAILQLPLAASIVGASQQDAQWLVDENSVGWKIEPQIDGWIEYSKMAQFNQVLPITSGVPGVSVYQGLPDDDTGFGLKTVTLKVQSLDSQKASIQTFFGATDRNHPNPDLTPNWFYYYNKLCPLPVFTTPYPLGYKNVSVSYCLAGLQFDTLGEPMDGYGPQQVKEVAIGNDGCTNWTFPVFRWRFIDSTLVWDGVLDINGIHKFAYTQGHELGHAQDYTTGVLNYKFSRTSEPHWHQFDSDGDGVTNKTEIVNGLDPNDPDSTGAFGRRIDGDAEVLASIHGLAKLLPNKSLWEKDWSSAGLQYSGLSDGRWGPYNPGIFYSSYWGLPVNTPYHPWDYRTVIYQSGGYALTGNHFSDPPSGAVTQVINPYQGGNLPYP